MKKLSKNLAMYICVFVAVFCAMTMKVEAENITTGHLGNNDGIEWTYNADTKTLTITGEDTGVMGNYYQGSVFKTICPEVEKIIMEDCTLYDFSYLFAKLDKLMSITFDGVDTSNVTKMGRMFYGCSSLESLDLSSFVTSQVTDMNYMFYGCKSLESINLSNFATSQVTDMSNMFDGCASLESLNLSTFDTSNVKDMNFMFRGCSSIERLDISGFNPSQVTNMSDMFYNCSNLTELEVGRIDTSQVTDMSYMFYNCSNLKKLEVGGIDTSKVEEMNYMFWGCSSLEELDVTSLDTSQATDMSYMFYDCSSLESLDLSTFDTSNVTKMHYMFYNCQSLKSLDLSGFNTSNVIYMNCMFDSCCNLISLDLSNFDTSNVINMDSMFYYCPSLKRLDISNFDLTNTTVYQAMLGWCDALEVVHAPKAMTAEQTIYLPKLFVDSKLNRTSVINQSFCGESLVDENKLVTEVSLNVTSLSLETGEIYQLQATVLPQGAAWKVMNWESSNNEVVTVDANGKVTAVGAGSATISATAKDGSGKSATCEVTVTRAMSEQEKQVRAFVERMYTIVLGRAAEEQGLNDWSARLLAKEIDGATLVDMFVNSDEFINRNTSDEEYIKILYRAVLGREADTDGLKMWKDMLADDWTRDYILDGLVLSTEFKNICDNYGIIAAFEPTAESQVRSFVKRMYTVVLNRRADAVGLDDWTRHLMNGSANGAQVADGFMSSDEFVNRNLSDEKYVKVLYRAFFNREPDEGGFNVWMNELAKGTSRRDVMKGFVHSVEFSDLCAQYGIIRGEIQ